MGRRGISQTLLAELTGISQAKVSKTVKNNQGSLTLDQLEVICGALKVSPTDVIERAERAVFASQRAQAEPTSQELADAALANTREGYDLAARRARKLNPGEEEDVEYYE